MNDHQEDIPSNASGNRPFEDVRQVNMGRRKLLKDSVAVTAGTAVLAASGTAEADWLLNRWGQWELAPLIGFEPVAVANGQGPEPAISPDYEYQVILPWCDPIVPSGPACNIPPSAADQAAQVGIGHDGMWYFPMFDSGKPRWGWDDVDSTGGSDDKGYLNPWLGNSVGGQGNKRGILCLNNEFGTNAHVLGKEAPESLEDVRISQHAHGVTVIELRRRWRYWRSVLELGRSTWETVESPYARRIHVNTPVEFSGPAGELDPNDRNSPLYNSAGNEPMGTVNNCSMGYTPWGTYLTCEENFNGYFGTEDSAWMPDEGQERLGMNAGGFGYGWHLFDERFDLANAGYANEHKRFGWVVEIDPFDPDAKPVKRTALGRKKNEGATCHVAEDGRVVVYNGDDQRFDYVYKYVSAEPWREMRSNGESPLDRGTLYVGKFNEDGTGDWLELSMNVPALAAKFSSLADLLIDARIAADIVGATPMDRPEWTTVGPDGQVYLSLTNNSRRTAPDPANPLVPNADGHIVRWTELDGHGGTSFDWEIFQIAENTHGTEESFADPDGIWCDPDGRLFIQTDGGQKDGLQNQMLVADATGMEWDGSPRIKRLFTGVPGCEITGIAVTPDRRTMFINIQHPGNGSPSVSPWPAPFGSSDIPRDATIVINRKDGGIIGS